MNNNEDWLSKLKDQVDNYEAPVSKDLWSDIERDLPKKSPVILFLKRSAAAAASIAAIAAVIIAVKFAFNDNTQSSLNSFAKTDIIKEMESETEFNKNIIIEPQSVKEYISNNTTTENAEIKHISTVAISKTEDSLKDISETTSAITDTACTVKTDNKETNRLRAIKEFKESVKTRLSNANTKAINIANKSNNERKWSISMAFNNGLGNRSTSANGFTPINNGYAVNKYTTRPDRKMRHFSYVYSSVVANNIEEETKTEIEYEIPLTYAAMFRYYFNKHWAIDAGVQFSHLGASWHSGSSNSFYSSTQKLIFVGLPIGASFTFVDTRFFSMYAIAGGSFDKCVSGSINRFAQSGRKHAKTGKRDLPEHPWQFSLNAGLGLQFNATSHIGIFAEPKATRFFDTAKELSLRKHDTEFQLLVGLRITY